MKTKILLLSAIISLICTQTALGQFIFDNSNNNSNNAVIEDEQNHVIEGNDTSQVNWTTQYIEAKGWSVMDTARFQIPDQAKAMARRGAIVDAQRNLLERIEGVRVVGETVVKDCVTQNDYIYTRLEGIIKGAELVGEPIIEGNTVEVRMRVPLYNDPNSVANVIHPVINNNSVNNNNTNHSVSEGEEQVIFRMPGMGNGNPVANGNNNGNGKGLGGNGGNNNNNNNGGNSMFPKIMDENGNVLLDLKNYYDPSTGKFPQYMQLSKSVFETLNIPQGTQVIDLLQGKNGNFTVNTGNLVKNPRWKKVGNFLKKAGSFLFLLL